MSFELPVEFAFVPREYDSQIFVHNNFVINVEDRISKRLHLVQNVLEKRVDHDVRATFVAEWTQPSLVLGIHSNVSLKIKALKMSADLPSCGHVDRKHRYRVSQVDGHLLGLLVLDHGQVLVSTLLASEKLLVPSKTNRTYFSPLNFYEIDDVLRLNYLNQKYGDNMSRVSIEALVVFLSLKNVD